MPIGLKLRVSANRSVCIPQDISRSLFFQKRKNQYFQLLPNFLPLQLFQLVQLKHICKDIGWHQTSANCTRTPVRVRTSESSGTLNLLADTADASTMAAVAETTTSSIPPSSAIRDVYGLDMVLYLLSSILTILLRRPLIHKQPWLGLDMVLYLLSSILTILLRRPLNHHHQPWLQMLM
jgi:hypothetical protein